MKNIMLAALCLFSAGCDSGSSVNVDQANDNQPSGGGVSGNAPNCIVTRHLETVQGILACVESLICDGTVVRGPDIVSVPIRQCNDLAASPSFQPTPLVLGSSGGIQGNL